jgi:protein TonB
VTEPVSEAAPARYFLANELDAWPAPLAVVEPPYPNDAYLRNIPGTVVVRLYLDESGKVEKATTLHAEPPGYFEEAVEQAFRSARFSPGMKQGHPVKTQMTVEVRYESPRPLAATDPVQSSEE